MPSFRKPDTQARHAVAKVSAIGRPRHGNHDGKIHSIGTARNYTQSVKLFAAWLSESRRGDLHSAGKAEAIEYLADVRAAEVGQKQLDQDRQALQAVLGERLPIVKSEHESIASSRAYSRDQLALVIASQGQKNALATEIAAAAGLRAHELLTIRPVAERPASSHREWRPDRFTDREGVVYTVAGKGGLVREVLLPVALAERLEARRLESPRTVIDRGIRYQQAYSLGGGAAWSQSFSAASIRILGWSQGAHGCRHTYAQERMQELGRMSYDTATRILAVELGHFRNEEKLIRVYLK